MGSFSWELFRYFLPLREPLQILGHELYEREGLILRLYEEKTENLYIQEFGEGEIVTLPGMHPESLSLAESQIRDYLSSVNNFQNQSSSKLYASVRFGLDMAIRTLIQKSNNFSTNCKVEKIFDIDFSSMSRGIICKKIPVNGLIIGSGISLEQECKLLRDEGYQAVKIKVGRFKLQEDLERVKTAREILGRKIDLRLDANRLWDWDEAVEFAHLVKDYNIEYCEEPLRDFKNMEKLHKETELPLALDESLWENPDPETLPKIGVKAFILKPGILGGWEKTKFWVDYSEKNRIKSVLGSSFESGLGLNWIAFIAANLLKKQFPMGIDTAKLFEHDLIDSPLMLKDGSYFLSDSWPIVNVKHLQHVESGTLKK